MVAGIDARELRKQLGGITRHMLDQRIEQAGIEPVGRVGIARIFAPDVVEKLRASEEARQDERIARAMGA